MTLKDLTLERPRSIPMTGTLIEAAKRMRDEHVEFLIVVGEDGKTPVSVLTDRP